MTGSWQETASGVCQLNVRMIKSLSDKFRGLLMKIVPEIVATAEAFSEDVTYIPVSALGCSPEEIPGVAHLSVILLICSGNSSQTIPARLVRDAVALCDPSHNPRLDSGHTGKDAKMISAVMASRMLGDAS